MKTPNLRSIDRAHPRSSARKIRRRPVQHDLSFRTWGGKRANSGRKPKNGRACVPHRVRPEHKDYQPVHVTMRAARRLGSLRRQSVFVAMRRALGKASRVWFRVVHFSVQADHVHLMVEADDRVRLSRGMAGLAIRVARAVNRVLRRRGRVWNDRYHARALRSPREVRHGLVYVVMNWRKHVPGARGFDPCSSAFWLDGWRHGQRPPGPTDLTRGLEEAFEPPVQPPSTWLASKGWRRHGLVRIDEHPTPAAR